MNLYRFVVLTAERVDEKVVDRPIPDLNNELNAWRTVDNVVRRRHLDQSNNMRLGIIFLPGVRCGKVIPLYHNFPPVVSLTTDVVNDT